MKLFFILLISLSIASRARAESIDHFTETVKTKNLDILLQNSLIEASYERSRGVNLSAPMIGISQMKSPQGQSYAFEVQQKIPLSAQLNDDKKSREAKFELQKKMSLLDSDKIILQARLSFVNYWVLDQKLKLIEELKAWLIHHAHYAQSQARSSSDLKVYALEIESKVGIFENDANDLRDELEIEKVKLKELVYDENYNPINPEVDEPKKLIEGSVTSKQASINLSKLKLATSDLAVANSSNYPNLYIKLRKLDRQMMGMANQEIMLGIDLPFAYFWQGKATAAEARANKNIAEANYKKSEIEASALKISLHKRAELLTNQLKILKTVSLPAAEKRIQYLKNISPRNMSGLESHHNIFHDYINLKIKLLEIRFKYEQLYSTWNLLYGEGSDE